MRVESVFLLSIDFLGKKQRFEKERKEGPFSPLDKIVIEVSRDNGTFQLGYYLNHTQFYNLV